MLKTARDQKLKISLNRKPLSMRYSINYAAYSIFVCITGDKRAVSRHKKTRSHRSVAAENQTDGFAGRVQHC